MRHRKLSTTLGRPTHHRLSMLRNLAIALLRHKKIKTTETRAKEVVKLVEKVITLIKKEDKARKEHEELVKNGASAEALSEKKFLFYRRRAVQLLPYKYKVKEKKKKSKQERLVSKDVLKDLYNIITSYTERKGGYTKTVKIGPRKGDNAPMVIVELV